MSNMRLLQDLTDACTLIRVALVSAVGFVHSVVCSCFLVDILEFILWLGVALQTRCTMETDVQNGDISLFFANCTQIGCCMSQSCMYEWIRKVRCCRACCGLVQIN